MSLFRNVILSGARSLNHLKKPANPRQILAAPAHRLYSSGSAPDRDPEKSLTMRCLTLDIQTDSYSEDLLPVWIVGKFACYIIDPYKERSEDPESTFTRIAKQRLKSEMREMRLYDEMLDLIQFKPYKEIAKVLFDKVAKTMDDDQLIEDLNKDMDDSSLRFTKFFFQGFGWPKVLMDEFNRRAAEVQWRKRTEAVIAEVKARAEAMAKQGNVGRIQEEAAAISATATSQLDQIEEILQLKPPEGPLY